MVRIHELDFIELMKRSSEFRRRLAKKQCVKCGGDWSPTRKYETGGDCDHDWPWTHGWCTPPSGAE